MPSIAGTPASVSDPNRLAWEGIAERIEAWAGAAGIGLRDAIVLLPFSALLPLARESFARRGGWMPRIETTRTLAAALAPAPPLPAGQISFDAATDALGAKRLLRGQGWVRSLAARDTNAFEQVVGAMVELAQALARAVAAIAPDEREAHWQRGRELLARGDAGGRIEQALRRIALEWAAASAPPASDALFALRPSAWIAVHAGGRDRLVEAVLRRAGEVPWLVIDTDVAPQAPFADVPPQTRIAAAVCDDFEDEAQRAAAELLALLAAGRAPLALIAQDRSLVRRIRALLERRGVALLDETGWRLSTTRGAARLMALLRAMAPQAGSDELLDWLKSGREEGVALPERASATPALESALRRRGWARVEALSPQGFEGSAARLVEAVQRLRRDFDAARGRSLLEWHDALRSLLEAGGDAAGLSADNAGAQVLTALRLGDGPAPDAHWLDLAGSTRLDYEALLRWVDGVLEQAAFVTAPPEAPQVVITPLARAMLRPFAAIVCPGADERRLGADVAPPPLLDDALAVALGLDGAEARRESQLLAFAQLLRAPLLVFSRRRGDAGEPLAASPLLERLGLALAHCGRAIEARPDARRRIALQPRATPPPMPVASGLLPDRLSASAVEALRECPYRFFALRLLGLREHDELDAEIEPRDYGSWLHAVLHRFHAARTAPAARDAELARLHEAADAEREAQGFDPAAFVPYAASFGHFAPLYIDWLHARDAQGAHYRAGEVELVVRPGALGGVDLAGRIDRIDETRGATELIDYKTGDVARLRARLRQQPAEDTQLAFYAALMLEGEVAPRVPLRASYLGLDARERIVRVEHPEVDASARVLLDGLARDLDRLRAGAPLPALGEGRACEHCAARGLCRRDDWAAASGA